MPIISYRALQRYISREHIVPSVFRREMEFTARSNDKKSRLRESSPSVRASHTRFARIILCESSDKPARIIARIIYGHGHHALECDVCRNWTTEVPEQ